MTYAQALEAIHSLHRFKKVPGLLHLRKLLHALGDPQDKLQFVHVAGTNGKGSTSTMIAEVLRKARYQTGLFVSPFVTDFCERIQLNNRPISHRALTQAAEDVLPLIQQMEQAGEELSEFEAVTAIGLYWFAQQKCDVVVLEVGLGGRLDATNVIDAPLCAVLTHISYDHTEILGDTLTQIASEKCGIIKEGCDVVCAPGQAEEALNVIRSTAEKRHCRLFVASEDNLHVMDTSLRGTRFGYRDQLIELSLLGHHQVYNAATALLCCEVLARKGMHINTRAMAAGLSATKLPARFELLYDQPIVLADGAHNPDGAQALSLCLHQYLSGRPLIALTGMCADKNIEGFVEKLAPLFREAVTLPVQNPRTIDPQALASLWQRAGVHAQAGQSPQQALALAVQLAGKDAAIIICGSLYLAGEMRPICAEVLPMLCGGLGVSLS